VTERAYPPPPRAGDHLVCNGERYLILAAHGHPKPRVLVRDHDGGTFVIRTYRVDGSGPWSVLRREKPDRKRAQQVFVPSRERGYAERRVA
jgi:hypothetical protein